MTLILILLEDMHVSITCILCAYMSRSVLYFSITSHHCAIKSVDVEEERCLSDS